MCVYIYVYIMCTYIYTYTCVHLYTAYIVQYHYMACNIIKYNLLSFKNSEETISQCTGKKNFHHFITIQIISFIQIQVFVYVSEIILVILLHHIYHY